MMEMVERVRYSKIKYIDKSKLYIYITMIYYCLKCRKNIESKNPKVVRTKNRRIIFLLKSSLFNSKKLKFLKEQEARGLLNS